MGTQKKGDSADGSRYQNTDEDTAESVDQCRTLTEGTKVARGKINVSKKREEKMKMGIELERTIRKKDMERRKKRR